MTVQEICNYSKLENFYTFAYELRKFDVSNKFTVSLLQDVVKCDILMRIITSNQWNIYFNKMEVDESVFSAQIVGSSNNVLTYSSDLHKRHIGLTQLSDKELLQEKPGAGKKKQLSSFKFLLTPDGLKIADSFDRCLAAQAKKKQTRVETK